HVVELNCIGILNSIINATAATLMGGTEDEVLKVLFSGYILGAGMAGLAYFVGAVYALTYAQVMLAEMVAGEAVFCNCKYKRLRVIYSKASGTGI
ncbi:MAG: hypothetical protein J6L77_10825, partial [Coprococcus sp.]|nr:hypothetical protein [Coprococcus sp.]